MSNFLNSNRFKEFKENVRLKGSELLPGSDDEEEPGEVTEHKKVVI